MKEEKVAPEGVLSDTIFEGEWDRKLFAGSQTLTARPSHPKDKLESGKAFGSEEC